MLELRFNVRWNEIDQWHQGINLTFFLQLRWRRRPNNTVYFATIPHFNMMFSHNLLETQTKEAKLEMPERLFDCLIQYIYTGEFLFICFKIY